MPVVAPADSTVPSEIPSTAIAALLLAARSYLVAYGLEAPRVSEIVAATGVARSRAFELKSRLEAHLETLVGAAGRPSRAEPAPEPASPGLTARMLDYVLEHPGCVSGGADRRRYSDPLRFEVLQWLDEHRHRPLEQLAAELRIPLGTLKDWVRDDRRPAADPGEPRQAAQAIDPTLPQLETLLAEWSHWTGGFSTFCDHVRRHCAMEWGRTSIARILEEHGVRLPRRRPGRSPDEDGLRGAFETFFPNAQWVGDGMQVVVEVDDVPHVFNVEMNVDAFTAAFVGAHVSATEDAAAVVAAFEDSVATTGTSPEALLLDNKPSNHTPAVDDALGSTLRIRATPYRPQNKAHVEGGFGLLKPTLEGLTLNGDTPQERAASFLRALVTTAARAINHRPRPDRGGASRADLMNVTPTPEQIEHARQALRERLEQQRKARATRAARQDPIVRSTIEEAFARLGLDDPQGHLLTATARYPLDAVVEGIAIYEARHRLGTLPEGVDARYLRAIVENVSDENEVWALAEALWDARCRAADRIAEQLQAEASTLARTARSEEDRLLPTIDRALRETRRLQHFFWLSTAADLINATPYPAQQALFRLAARRIAATRAIPRERRAAATRFLAAKVRPFR